VLLDSPSPHAPPPPDLAERRFCALQQAIPEIVWSVSASGDLLHDAPAWRELTGQTEEQLLSRLGWLEVVHPEDRQRTLQTFLAAANEGEAWSAEHRLRLADGTFRRMRARGAPVLDDSGRVLEIIVVHATITESEESQSEELLGIVGHDLRDPLNIVLLGTTLLRMTELRDEQRKPVARIAAAAQRAVRMLETLLDFTQARIGGGIKLRCAPTDLARLCTDLAAEQERIQVGVTAAGDCTGSWDRARLEQLIGNLLRNAAEHGAPGGAVELRCTAESDRVVLSVRNSGEPVAAEMLPTLFEPFKRGARGLGSRNLGLGLYIVRQIAVAHGGSVEARSSAEEGTEFRVLLPR
jgi:PAS domain S-box-containing protein